MMQYCNVDYTYCYSNFKSNRSFCFL